MSNEFSSRGFWSCAKDEPLGRIARGLSIPETFCLEIFPGHEWDREDRIAAELKRVFPFLPDAAEIVVSVAEKIPRARIALRGARSKEFDSAKTRARILEPSPK